MYNDEKPGGSLRFQENAPPLQWEQRVGAPAKWLPEAREMRRHPGQWTLFLEDVGTGTVSHMRRGTPAFPKGQFEFTVRGLDKSTQRSKQLWARYIGENGEYRW